VRYVAVVVNINYSSDINYSSGMHILHFLARTVLLCRSVYCNDNYVG